ncbi:MAG: hypothetical protein RR971_03710 [Alistipes sp.]
MKTQKGRRDQDHADELRKAKRLEPVHKSGKERHALYSQVNDDEDNEPIVRQESTRDYFDDEDN